MRVLKARHAREREAFFLERADALIRALVTKLVNAVKSNEMDTLTQDGKNLVAQVEVHSTAKLAQTLEALNAADAQRQAQVAADAAAAASADAVTHAAAESVKVVQGEWFHVVPEGDAAIQERLRKLAP